jgi:predicted kinase
MRTDPTRRVAAGARPGLGLPVQHDTLLERDLEVARLRELVRAALAGEAHVVLVEGAAGIGKSRLLAEVRRDATTARMRVLAARGSELEREFPFGVVRQLFEASVADPERAARLFGGAAAAARPLFESLTGAQEAGDASFASLPGSSGSP